MALEFRVPNLSVFFLYLRKSKVHILVLFLEIRICNYLNNSIPQKRCLLNVPDVSLASEKPQNSHKSYKIDVKSLLWGGCFYWEGVDTN